MLRLPCGRRAVFVSLIEQLPADERCEVSGQDGETSPEAAPFSSIPDRPSSDTARNRMVTNGSNAYAFVSQRATGEA